MTNGVPVDDRHLILPMIVYPRQVLGVPPSLMMATAVALTILGALCGLFTGDMLQVEMYALYIPAHMWLQRAYRDDPFLETVWRARLWDRQPWGPPVAMWRRTRNRLAVPSGVSRFS